MGNFVDWHISEMQIAIHWKIICFCSLFFVLFTQENVLNKLSCCADEA